MSQLKIDGWEVALAGAIASARRRPFVWGETDCCTWAAQCITAQTGQAVPLPAYSSEAGALEVIQAHGGLAETVTTITGLERVPPRLAQRGDLVRVWHEGPWGEALAVCVGDHALAAGPRGLESVPMADWLDAWRVSCRP